MRKDCHIPTYHSWRSLRNRCDNKHTWNYHRYGGSGVTYDSRWDFYDLFLEDMGERPDGKTLDRIDNTKGYFKENCRWATPSEQQKNRSCSMLITFNGITKNASDWALDLGMSKSAVWQRIVKYKWTVEKALTTPKGVRL